MGAPRRQSVGCITSPEAPRFPKPPRSTSAEAPTRPPPGAGKSSGVRRKVARERSGGVVEEVVADLKKDPRWDD